jgi:hypothetical protein
MTEIVHLDVGGVQYHVARDTLLSAENTMLAKIVSDKWTTGHNQEIIFIDRDGERFKYILDWYRDRKIVVPKTVALDALRSEASFFGLPDDAIIEEERSVDKILIFLGDGAAYLDELNTSFEEGVMQNEVSNGAIWAIQQLLKALDFNTRSRGSFEVDLFQNNAFEKNSNIRPFILNEIKKILAKNKLLSSSMIEVTGSGKKMELFSKLPYTSGVKFSFL